MNSTATRYLVLRVPNSGPKALAGAPNDFASLEDAKARVSGITSQQLKVHHTCLEIVEYSGDKATFLESEGILT
ncbi:MAG: hypothetical protein AAGB07_02235 [Pseudomonadota bacterium]